MALNKSTLNVVFLNLLALLLLVFIVAPFLWVAVASFQGENELLSRPPHIIPQNPTLDNYNYVFTGKIPQSYEVRGQLRSRISQEARLIAPALKNSFIVAGTVMLINLLFGTPAADTFARIAFKGKKPAYNFILASRLLPGMAIAIPYFVIIQSLKLMDTYTALILVHHYHRNGRWTTDVTLTIADATATVATYALFFSDVTIEAAAASAMASFRYVVIYNSNDATGHLVGYYDYGTDVNLSSGEKFVVDFDSTNGMIRVA